jgi:glutamate/tyrosine decarboxylase-like PLP-dependent enzyme
MSDWSFLISTAGLATAFLENLRERRVAERMSRAELYERFNRPVPETGADPRAVIGALANDVDGGLVASAGPRYFGFVTGGAVPAAVAADWLVAAWDQNAGLYAQSPAVAAIEEVTAAWLLDLLGLPRTASVGFVTGAHTANVTALAAARHHVLGGAGWDVERDGLQDAPKVAVFVGDDVHVSVVGALRLLGFGAGQLRRVPADAQGRMQPAHLGRMLGEWNGPAIVSAQVGNVNTGACDPIADVAEVTRARGAWLHVDGAFGLWAATVPELAPLVAGVDRADSWATDAHKWLNVPYDSGIVCVAHPEAHRGAMSLVASYLTQGADRRNGMDWVPESSRRARAVPVYAALRSLGRAGVSRIVSENCRLARHMAARLAGDPRVRILNDVVLNQVLVRFDAGAGADGDAVTQAVVRRVQDEGTCWLGTTAWRGRTAMRISVSNWMTTDDDIDRSADAILSALSSVISNLQDA